MQNWFTSSPLCAIRMRTPEITIGNLKMGSKFPVRVQSMANTPTHNVEASVQQAIEIIEAGGELVRFAVINQKDAEALKDIKQALVDKNYLTPIVADVHFNASLADTAALYVDKVRINPGNYIDKRATFTQVDFTDTEYAQELEKLKERFVAFLAICKTSQTAIRIGTNHGSLSDRIMSRYGDTPAGMVEATMEFLRICNAEQFKNVVVSLKSSNTRVMVHAYRLLAKQMQDEEIQFGLHLGVTEAGSGEDGRIKSAVGIGALMHDGLGDTIRVSLTEHPEKEIPVGKTLINHFETITSKTDSEIKKVSSLFNPYEYKARAARQLFEINEPVVIGDLSAEPEITRPVLEELGFVFNTETKVIERSLLAPDVLYSGEQVFPFNTPENTTIVTDSVCWNNSLNAYPLFSFHEYITATEKSETQNWVQIEAGQLTPDAIKLIKEDKTLVLVAFSYQKNQTAELRSLINLLMLAQIDVPIVIQRNYAELNVADFQLKSAADNGILFIDGLVNGLWLKNTFTKQQKNLIETSFAILQASRCRTTKTEYISCPGCGRTLFDLEQTLSKVKATTQHLTGLKIAVMGCIVNGPGEMADADYGYVGEGAGKVSLYKGNELIKRGINAESAVDELLNLIQQNFLP